MYHKERMINGVLHTQNVPNGKWYPKSASTLSSEVEALRAKLSATEDLLDEVKQKVVDLRKDLSVSRVEQETKKSMFVVVC